MEIVGWVFYFCGVDCLVYNKIVKIYVIKWRGGYVEDE